MSQNLTEAEIQQLIEEGKLDEVAAFLGENLRGALAEGKTRVNPNLLLLEQELALHADVMEGEAEELQDLIETKKELDALQKEAEQTGALQQVRDNLDSQPSEEKN